MLKTCPLTQVTFQNGQRCPKENCALWMIGGCAVVLAAQLANDASNSVDKLAQKLQHL